MNRRLLIKVFFIISISTGFAQTESLSNSPYSLYGLGLYNDIGTGKTNSLGKTGIAMSSYTAINSFNPASLGTLFLNSFLYDIGFKAQIESLSQKRNKEYKRNGSFSNIAFAFPVDKNSAFSVTLIPYTNVGYLISGIKTQIEGYEAYYLSDFEGSGGLNDFKISYGHSFKNKIRLGISGSLLFGSITQKETNYIGSSKLVIEDRNVYSGFRMIGGIQYDLTDKISFGAIYGLLTNLNAKQEYTINQDNVELLNSNRKIDKFQLPTEIGFGTQIKFNPRSFVNIDYKKRFWNSTGQSDGVGDFVDQQFFGLGIEYMPSKPGFSYFNKIQYRIGFNYDNGYLSIDNNRIDNYAINAGIGLPLKSGINNSFINIAYSYGKNGKVSNGLIRENYHMLTLNLSLEGLWFQKRKIN